MTRSVQGGWTIGTVTLAPDDDYSNTETLQEQERGNLVLQYQVTISQSIHERTYTDDRTERVFVGWTAKRQFIN